MTRFDDWFGTITLGENKQKEQRNKHASVIFFWEKKVKFHILVYRSLKSLM